MHPRTHGAHPLDRIDPVAIQLSDVQRAITWSRQKFDIDGLYKDDSRVLPRFDNINLTQVIAEQHPPHIVVVSDVTEHFVTLTRHRHGTRSVYIHHREGNADEIMAAD